MTILCIPLLLMALNWSIKLAEGIERSPSAYRSNLNRRPAIHSIDYQASFDRKDYMSTLNDHDNHPTSRPSLSSLYSNLFTGQKYQHSISSPPTSSSSSSTVVLNTHNNNDREPISSSDLSSFLSNFNAHEKLEPYFDNNTSTNIATSVSKTVFLPCRVHNLGDRTVSWIRRNDLNPLTIGKITYTSDQRFQAVHMENSDDWSLQIGYPSREDAGVYECQVSTRPPKSLFVTLNVIVSKAKIIGSPTIYLNSESLLSLICVVEETPGPPDYIFWYHNGQVINYDSSRNVDVFLEKSAQSSSSKLIIQKAHPSDSGNYSCVPANAEPAHIAVHVLNNSGQPAAMQHEKRSAESFHNSASTNRMNIFFNSRANQFLIIFQFKIIFQLMFGLSLTVLRNQTIKLMLCSLK
ncbi:uncharacterized protein LOC141848969 [Brevipalpus obovatus]|uniref:uncharacterized protein LOC141848969 n=1 Tax=Brevipalpus obovatus TaxID=246614 RepID=UPI003D9ECC5A